jgi:hypothetical protein
MSARAQGRSLRGGCIDIDFARCKEEARCGAPQERALTAVQFEQDEAAMEFRAAAQSGEIVCAANHDLETKSSHALPFLIIGAPGPADVKFGPCRQELCAVRPDQVWRGLPQKAHERAGFPGLRRETHRARHTTDFIA